MSPIDWFGVAYTVIVIVLIIAILGLYFGLF